MVRIFTWSRTLLLTLLLLTGIVLLGSTRAAQAGSGACLVGPSPHMPKTTRAAALKLMAKKTGLRDVVSHPIRDIGKDKLVNRLSAGTPKPLVTGTKSMPCVLMKFTDAANTYAPGTFQQMLFTPNGIPTGSVHDFYEEVSRGRMSVTGNVYGWFTTDHERAYYGEGTSPLHWTSTQAAYEAAQKADAAGVNWAQFDNNHDGFVDTLWVAHSGVGMEETGADNLIWSHSWSFSDCKAWDPAFPGVYVTQTDDPYHPGEKIKIDDYIIMPETSYWSGGAGSFQSLVGIGVFCHEFGHAIGLPDLYDTSTNGRPGLGNASLMAGGSWGGNGDDSRFPAHPDAWCKADLGWITPPTVTTDGFQSIPRTEDCPLASPAAFIFKPAGTTSTQYFLVENRQHSAFDRTLFATGLFIYHVDESIISANRANNSINSTAHLYGVALEEADAADTDPAHMHMFTGANRGLATDSWPNGTKAEFSPISSPNTEQNDGSPFDCAIQSISAKGHTMSAFFRVHPSVLTVHDYAISDTADNGNSSGYVDPGEIIKLTVNLINNGTDPVTGITAQLVTSTPGVTILQGNSAYANMMATGVEANTTPFQFKTDLTYPVTTPIEFSLLVTTASGTSLVPLQPLQMGSPSMVQVFLDNVEAGAGAWTHSGTLDSWAIVEPGTAPTPHSPTHCWFANDPASTSEQLLVSPPIGLPGDVAPRLHFWHTYSFESGYDGGMIQISSDGGLTYTDLGSYITSGGYNSTGITGLSAPGWTGGAIGNMSEVIVDLSSFAGQTVLIRWRLGSDSSVSRVGWYVDDILIDGDQIVTTAVNAIQVTSPNGGQIWKPGTTQTITWTKTGTTGANVSIKLYQGTTLARTIYASTPNDGSQPWAIPSTQAVGENYIIVIASTTTPAINDASNAPFAIRQLYLTAPNGGEAWEAGTVHNITWERTTAVGTYVKLDLLRNGAVVCPITAKTLTSAQTYAWTIPADLPPGDGYAVRITSLSNATLTDTSDDVFFVDQALYQPDLMVKLDTGTDFLGNNIYNTTGANQTLVARALPGTTKSFIIELQNDGEAPDSMTTNFTVAVTTTGASAPQWTMKQLGADGKDVTSAVKSATGLRVTLLPLVSNTYQIDVTAGAAGSDITLQMSAASADDGTKQDVIKTVTAARLPLTGVSLQASPATQVVSKPVVLTAVPAGGFNVQYKFRAGYQSGGVWNWSTIREYGYSPTCTWTTPSTARTYTLTVWAKEDGSTNTLDKSAVLGYVVRPVMTDVNISASPTGSQAVNLPVVLTGSAVNGANVQYKFRVGYTDGTTWTWTVIREYETTATCTWTPTVARGFTLQVWARETGSTAAYDKYKSTTYTVLPALTAVRLATSPASPSPVNTDVTLTATATGGKTVQYLFRAGYFDGANWQWTAVRDWGTSRTCTWHPTTARTYTLVVLAREAGTTMVPVFNITNQVVSP